MPPKIILENGRVGINLIWCTKICNVLMKREKGEPSNVVSWKAHGVLALGTS